MTPGGTLKLADFGTAFELEKLTNTRDQTLAGTYYCAARPGGVSLSIVPPAVRSDDRRHPEAGRLRHGVRAGAADAHRGVHADRDALLHGEALALDIVEPFLERFYCDQRQ